MSRFSNALYIQEGASNPSGIARSLVLAIDEARKENSDTDFVRNDPAVRLIVHQLAYLCRTYFFDHATGGSDTYEVAMATCRDRARALGERIPGE